MREILFRGKRLDIGEWVEGAFCPKNCDLPFGPMVDDPSIIKLDDPCSGFWFSVDGATVGQYTGLKDKNGKRIFEGDIVRHYNDPENPNAHDDGVVWWDDDRLCFKRTSGEENVLLWKQSGGCYYEIIGNIHDNQELMGGGNSDDP